MPDWLFSTDTFGRVRIDPRSTNSDKPVFVGIAATKDVNAYLDQVQRDEISDLDFDPFTIDKSRHAGEARPAMPAAQTFWAASSVDGRPLDWKVRKGEWSVVMMNADGSPGVSVDASVGAKTPIIRDLAWWLTIPGIGLGLIALVLVTLRRPRPLARRRAAVRGRRGARVRVVPREGAGPSRPPPVVSRRRRRAGAPCGRRRRRGRRRAGPGRRRCRPRPSHDGPACPEGAAVAGAAVTTGAGSVP